MPRVLVGDDHPEYVNRYLPFNPLPDDLYVVTSSEGFVVAATNPDSTWDAIVTDLGYGPGLPSGLDVLADPRVRALTCPKFLWTGDGDRVGVRQEAKRLGAVVIDKAELFTAMLVGLSTCRASVSTSDVICIYAPQDSEELVLVNQAIAAAGFFSGSLLVVHDLEFVAASGMHTGLFLDLSKEGNAFIACARAAASTVRASVRRMQERGVALFPLLTTDPYLLGFEVVGRIQLFLQRKERERAGT